MANLPDNIVSIMAVDNAGNVVSVNISDLVLQSATQATQTTTQTPTQAYRRPSAASSSSVGTSSIPSLPSSTTINNTTISGIDINSSEFNQAVTDIFNALNQSGLLIENLSPLYIPVVSVNNTLENSTLITSSDYSKLGIGKAPIYTLDVNGDINLSSGNVIRIDGTQLDTSNIPEDINTNLYFTYNRVRETTLTGLSIAGSAIVAGDTVLEAFGKIQNQINGLVGGVTYQGTWNANTNSPTITSSTGTKGYYYVVSVAGATSIDGQSDWKVGDWIIFDGSTWSKVDNTEPALDADLVAIASLTGTSGLLRKTAADTWELDTNTYLTSYTETDPIYTASSWYTTTNNSSDWDTAFGWGNHADAGYLTSITGYVPDTRTITINGVGYDLSADRSWTVTVTDADTVDGVHAASFLRNDTTNTGTLSFDTSAAATTSTAKIFFGQSPSPDGSLNVNANNFASYGVDGYGLILQSGYGDADMGGIKITDDGVIIFGASDENLFTVIDEDGNTIRFNIDGSGNIQTEGSIAIGGASGTISGNTILHAGNYNSYSPTLTGGGASGVWNISVSGSSASASTVTVNSGNSSGAWYPIVWHSGNSLYSSSGTAQIYPAGGYIMANYFNSSDSNESGITNFIVKNGDNYHRSASPTVAADTIRGVASGTWGISISGTSGATNSMYSTGYGNGTFTWRQDSATFGPYSGWHNYLISNHGDGATYYNTIIAMPFWGAPLYSRMEGGTQRPAYKFWTSEIPIDSSNYISAPVFYDYNDTVYYVDAASTTVLRQVRIYSATNSVGDSLQIYSTTTHQYPQIYSDGGLEAMWNYKNNASEWYVGLRTSSGLSGTTGFHFYNTNQGEVAGIDLNGNSFSRDSFRAPIFYDSNDTSYYLDPAGGFNFNLGARKFNSYAYGTNLTTNTAGGWAQAHRIYNEANTGATWYYGVLSGSDFYIKYGSQASLDITGYNSTVGMTVNSNGTVQATGDMRAPLYYDLSDTNYYTDPASGTVLGGKVRIQSDSGSYGQFQINSSSTSVEATALFSAGGSGQNSGQYTYAGVVGLGTHGYGKNFFCFGASYSSPAFYIPFGTTYAQAVGSFRAPVFYDSDDTAFYIDPSYQAKIERMTVGGDLVAATHGGGRLRVSSYSIGSTEMNADTHNIVLGPYTTRSGTGYYAGIAINGLMNYSNSNSYDVAPHIWIGAQYRDTPGSERSDFVIGIKSGTGISGTGADIPQERLRLDYTGKLSITGDINFGGSLYKNGVLFTALTGVGLSGYYTLFTGSQTTTSGQIWQGTYTTGFGVTTNNFSYRIDVNGSIRVSGQYYTGSDIRLKSDIVDLQYGLNEIMQLNPKKYIINGNVGLGLIAQEVKPIIDEIVLDSNEDYWALNYVELIPVLINAVKELKAEIDILKNK